MTSLVAQLVKNLSAMQEMPVDRGLTPGSGRSPGRGNGNPLQYSCLENSMGYHGVVESWTRLNNFHFSPQLLYSTVNRHLDCFHVFAIVSSAAKNIGILESF